MKKNLFFGFLLCWVFIGTSQEKWSLKKDTKGIQIYTRSVPNTTFNEYRATTTLNTKINNVLMELLDAPEYFKGCVPGISYYLREKGKDQHVFYVRKNMPWPIKDRDIVILLSVERIAEDKIKLSLKSLPDGMAQKENTIRIKNLMGHWLLEENENKTRVTQQLFVDPEGSLPAFITNSLLVKGPLKTFVELKESVKKYTPSYLKEQKSVGL